LSVNTSATCAAATGQTTLAFTDTPLSQIEVKFTSSAGSGVTNASIVCSLANVPVNAASENGAADPARDDTDETFTNLAPGVYTCTVDIDP
jgi:hypothetical protein